MSEVGGVWEETESMDTETEYECDCGVSVSVSVKCGWTTAIECGEDKSTIETTFLKKKNVENELRVERAGRAQFTHKLKRSDLNIGKQEPWAMVEQCSVIAHSVGIEPCISQW